MSNRSSLSSFRVSPQRRIATVFGGSGFVGSQVVRALAAAGFQVRVAVRRPSCAQNLRVIGDVGQVVPLYADLNHKETIEAAVQGASFVVNATGILFESRNASFEDLHSRGPGWIAEACSLYGVQNFVHISAIGADPSSAAAYARSKAKGETAVRKLFPKATILRPSIIFGQDDAFFNRFASLARFSPFLPLIGGGTSLFQPVYVGDVTKAVIHGLGNERAAGQTYELGGPNQVSFEDLMRFVLDATGRERRLLTLPMGLAKLMGRFGQVLPNPQLTYDQVLMLQIDNVVNPEAKGLKELGISAQSFRAIVPAYLQHFRRGGRFLTRQVYR